MNIKTAKERLWKQIIEQRKKGQLLEVVGVGIGKEEIAVLVEKKTAELEKKVKELDSGGYRVRIEVTGKIKVLYGKGDCIKQGTLTLPVFRGDELMLLSNNHVLCGNTDMETVVPKGANINDCRGRVIGTLEDWKVLTTCVEDPTTGEIICLKTPNTIDAALVKPKYPEEITGINEVTAIEEPYYGQSVEATGARTGKHVGTVKVTDMSVIVGIGGYLCEIADCFLASFLTEMGDSGSLVLSSAGKAVGMIFGGQRGTTSGAIACKMSNVVSQLGIKLTGTIKPTNEIGKDTSRVHGYAGFYWTPTEADIGKYGLKAIFQGDSGYNACESTKTVTVSADRFEVTVTEGVPTHGCCLLACDKLFKIPFTDTYAISKVTGCPNKIAKKIGDVVIFDTSDSLEVGKKYVINVGFEPPYPFDKPLLCGGYRITAKTDEFVEFGGVKKINVKGFYEAPGWQKWWCGVFDVAEADCNSAWALAPLHILYAPRSWSCVLRGKQLDGVTSCTPTKWDHVFVGLDCFVFVPVGRFAKMGGRGAKLAGRAAENANVYSWIELIGRDKLVRAIAGASEDSFTHFDDLLKAGKFTDAESWVNRLIITPDWAVKSRSVKELTKQIDVIIEHAKKYGKLPTKIIEESGAGAAHAKAAVQHGADYADDIGKLRKYFKETVIWDDIVEFDKNIFINVDEYGKVLPGSTSIHPSGIRHLDIYRIDGLTKSGNVAKLKAGGRLDNFLRYATMDISKDPAKFRKLIGTLSDAEADTIVRELKAVGKVDEASLYKGLRTSSKRVKSGGAVDGVKEVADDVKGVKGAEAQKTAHKIGKDAAENIPPTAADNAKNAAHSKFFSKIKLPKVVKYLVDWKVWTFYMSFCFFPFIAEETAQRVGFLSIPDMATIQSLIRLDQKEKAVIELNRAIIEIEGDPATGEKGIIKEFNDKVNFWYDVASVPCFWMKPWYDRYFEVHNYDLTEKARNYKVLRDALKENLSLTPDDVGSIEVITNLAGARVHIDGFPTFVLTTKINGKSKAIIHNIKTEAGTIGTQHSVTVFDQSGTNLMDSALVTVYKNQTAKIEFTLNPYSDVPEDALGALLSYIDSLNEVGGQSGLEKQRQPYGKVDPDTWFYGTCKFNCTSTPSGAWVWIDGEDKKKQTPCYIDDITAYLPHRVEFRHPNYPVKVFNQWAKTDKTIDIDCVFEEPCSEPSAHIKPTTFTPKVGETVVFDPSGSDPGTDASYKTNGLEWDFGDGAKETKTTEEKVSHSYSAKGVYHVNLKVTNDCGNSRDATPVVITVEVATGNIKCYCEPAEYCSRNADIFVDGNKVDVTKSSGYTYIKDLTPGAHTVKYNLLDVMECIDDVVVTADEDAIHKGVLALSERIKSKCSYDSTNFYYKDVKVTKIVDGDSIFTDFTNPFPKPPLFPAGQQVRIAGYDSPDGATARANAKAKLTELIPIGSTVTLKIWPPAPLGKLNRVLAGVFKGDVDIAIEMLKSCLVNETSYKQDKFPWVDWTDYDRLWKDPVGTDCLTNPVVKPLIADVNTTSKTYKINNRWFTLDFKVRYEDMYGVQKGLETKMQVDGRKLSTPIAYAAGTYAIKLFACIEKCTKAENWILVDTKFIPTTKTVKFVSVPSGAACTVVRKETAHLVRTLKRVIRI